MFGMMILVLTKSPISNDSEATNGMSSQVCMMILVIAKNLLHTSSFQLQGYVVTLPFLTVELCCLDSAVFWCSKLIDESDTLF